MWNNESGHIDENGVTPARGQAPAAYKQGTKKVDIVRENSLKLSVQRPASIAGCSARGMQHESKEGMLAPFQPPIDHSVMPVTAQKE